MATADDVTQLRRILGPTLQYVRGKLDVAQYLVDAIGAGGGGGPGPGPEGSGFASPFRPLEEFLAEGQTSVTQSNFAATLRAAHNAAIAADSGFRIGIPACPDGVVAWQLTESFIFPGQYRNHAIIWEGAGRGATKLQWKVKPAAGYRIALDGYTSPEGGVQSENVYWSGLRNLSVWDDFDAPKGGTGIYIRHAVMCQLADCNIEGFAGSDGIAIWIDGSYPGTTPLIENVQNLTIQNCQIGLNRTGMKMRSNSVFRHIACDFNANAVADVELDSFNQGDFYGNMFQSGVAANIVSTASEYEGGEKINFTGNSYHEGGSTSFIKIGTKTGDNPTFNQFIVDTTQGTNYDIFADLTDVSYFKINRLIGGPNSKVIKARNCDSLVVESGPSPETGFYDLDEYSKYGLVVLGAAAVDAPSSLGHWSHKYTVTGILEPHAEEIFDPSVLSSAQLSEDEAESLFGVLRGTEATVINGPAPFKFSAVGANGNATISTEQGGAQITGQLLTAIAPGEQSGIFVVMRVSGSGFEGGRATGPNLRSAASSISIGGGDGNDDQYYGIRSNAGGASFAISTQDADEAAFHAILFQNTAVGGGQHNGVIYVDSYENSVTFGTDPREVTDGMTRFWFSGHADDLSAGAPPSDREFAYVAFLRSTLSPGQIKQLFDAARTRFGIGKHYGGQTVSTDHYLRSSESAGGGGGGITSIVAASGIEVVNGTGPVVTVGSDYKTESLYVRPPFAPHADDDEFDSGSPDLAVRGYTLIAQDASGGPTVMTRVGNPLWHDDTAGGMTDTQYRSKIVGSKLFLQFPNFDGSTHAYDLFKSITQDGQGGFFAARITGVSSPDGNVFDDGGMRGNRFLQLHEPGTGARALIGANSGTGINRTLYREGFGGAGEAYSTRTTGDNTDTGGMDVYAINTPDASANPYSPEGYFINSSTGYLFPTDFLGPACYTPADMGFSFRPGSRNQRAWRIYEIDYLRRYPFGSWFGA